MQLTLLIFAFVLGVLGPAQDEDVLGDIVVEATEPTGDGPNLMRLAVVPVVGEGRTREFAEGVLRRDLDLSGQFRLLEAEDGNIPRRAEAVLRTELRSVGGGRVQLQAQVFFDPEADVPAYTKTVETPLSELRWGVHRLVDDTMATLTGYRGPFESRLTFVTQRGDTRSAYVIDADGHGLRRLTTDEQLVSTSVIAPDGSIYYAASVDHGRYRLYRAGEPDPIPLRPPGSVYGLAFSPDGDRIAMTIAVGSDVRLYTGPADFSPLRRSGTLTLALSPAISRGGKVAISGTTAVRPRVWVDGRAASPRYGTASAPDFCEHPDGTRLVYALGTRRRSHLVVGNERGRGAKTITRGSSRNSHPACSPDGRLVAFFSDRRSGQGPGLYVVRIDGYHLRKVADVRGDSLQWARTKQP